MSEPVPSRVRVRTWDVPTRLVHWLMVVAIGASWWTGEEGHLEWHRWSGYTLLGLVIFRIYWGFFGSSTARFRHFVRGPAVIAQYLRGRWTPVPGHNPLGALSVLSLIIVLFLQIVLGLFAVDVDGLESGPLSMYVSFETGRLAAEWHEWVFNLLMCLIVLHIAAIAWYRFVRKENLLPAMFHGARDYLKETPAELPPVQAGRWLHLITGLIIAIGLSWAVSRAFEF